MKNVKRWLALLLVVTLMIGIGYTGLTLIASNPGIDMDTQEQSVNNLSADGVIVEEDTSQENNIDLQNLNAMTYAIKNDSYQEIKVTIHHVILEKDPNTQKDIEEEIYSTDEKVLSGKAEISNYKKATNYTIKSVYNKTENEPIQKDNIRNIVLSENTELKVIYEPIAATTTSGTTFFDYTVQPPASQEGDWHDGYWDGWWHQGYWDGPYYQGYENSINTDKNFQKPDEQTNRFLVGKNDQNYGENKCDTYVDGKPINDYTSGQGDNAHKTGIVKGLTNELRDVAFSVDEPGVFSMETKRGKTILTDYQLVFDKSGDTYSLTKVLDKNNNCVASAGSGFFPLDGIKQTDWAVDDTHNYFFGMRYDVQFTLGDYVGSLNYSFSGDDDLWVILDGKQVVIDLGGIHDTLSDTTDLWKYIDKDDPDYKSATHTLTILYMERGAYASNCTMNFTIPNANIVDITDAKSITVELNKENSSGEGLSGGNFELANDNQPSDKRTAQAQDGKVKFDYIKEGTYTLTEVNAPSDYVLNPISTENTYKIIVTTAENESLSYQIFKADGVTLLEDNTIVNYRSSDYLDYHKTAECSDYDKREYQIYLSAVSKIVTSSTTTSTETITKPADVMMVFDLSGSMNGGFGNQDTSPGMTRIGQFNNISSALDTTKIYYWKSDMSTPSVTGEGYEYAKYIVAYDTYSDKWKKKDLDTNSGWENVGRRDVIYTWNSRITALKEAANQFTRDFYSEEIANKLGIASFYGYKQGWENYTTGKLNLGLENVDINNIVDNVNVLKADGGTSPQLGLETAKSELDNASSDGNNKFVILFSDGEPSDESDKNSTITKAKEIRDAGYTLICVGLGLNSDTQDYMKSLASTKEEGAPYCYTAETANELTAAFQQIQQEVSETTTTVPIGQVIKGANITDTVTSEFVLTDTEAARLEALGATVAVNSDNTTTVTWTNQDIPYSADGSHTWNQVIHVAARDDFMGGNSIATNVKDSSTITVPGFGTFEFQQPTVNVKLLDMNVPDKEVTVYRGNIIASSGFAKELADTFAVLKFGSKLDTYTSEDLVSAGISSLTEADLKILDTIAEGTNQSAIVSKDYAYGSNGVVGHFEFQYVLAPEPVERSTESAENHEATTVGNHVETYQLLVTYVPNETDVSTVGTKVERRSTSGNYYVNVLANWYIFKQSSSVGSDGKHPMLTGAEFTLTRTETEPVTGNNEQAADESMQDDTTSIYYGKSGTDGKVAWYKDDTYESGSKVDHIEDGIYQMQEIKAPVGYSLSSDVWEVTILNQDVAIKNIEAADTPVINVTYQDAADTSSDRFFYFEDDVVYSLPNAGGVGIYWYTIGGVVLMLAAALILYKKKKYREVLIR